MYIPLVIPCCMTPAHIRYQIPFDHNLHCISIRRKHIIFLHFLPVLAKLFEAYISLNKLFIRPGNLFSLLLCSLWWVQIFGYVLACRSYSFVCTVHHLIIIIVQTYLKALNLLNLINACQIYFVECVSKIKHILPIIHYVGLYVFSLPIYLVMIERIYILRLIIIIKSEPIV